MNNMLPNVLENLIEVLYQQGQGFMDYRVRGTSTETTVTLKFSSHDTSSTPVIEVKNMNSKARRDINRITRFNEHFNSVDSGNNTESSYIGQSTVELNIQQSSTPNLESRSTKDESFCNQDIKGPSQTVKQCFEKKSKQSLQTKTQQCHDVQLKISDDPLSEAEPSQSPNTRSDEYPQNHKHEPLQEYEHHGNKQCNHESIIGKITINSNITEHRNKEIQCCPTVKCVETQRTLLTKTKSTDTFQLVKCNRRNMQTQVTDDDLDTEDDTNTNNFNEMCKAAVERSLTKFDNMTLSFN